VIRRIIDEQYTIARKLIEDNKDKMHAMAKALLEWETIDASRSTTSCPASRRARPRTGRLRPARSGGGTPPPVGPDGAPAAA
jgi:cell division protease FtsH